MVQLCDIALSGVTVLAVIAYMEIKTPYLYFSLTDV